MANKKITALTAITALDVADVLPVADVSIPETKKITAANLWLGGFNAHKDTDGTFAANSDLVFPTQKAAKTYVDTAAAAKISDTAFGAGWNAVTTIAPSKNAVYDAFQLYLPLAGGTMSGSLGIDHIEEATSAHGVAVDGLTIKDGNIVLSGGQIAFPATADPSTGANTLDDYEEGTWTPALSSTGATFSYSFRAGSYTKIGRQVFLYFLIALTGAPTGTLTNVVLITGLPFTIATGSLHGFTTFSLEMSKSPTLMDNSSSTVHLRDIDGTQLTAAIFTGASYFYCFLTHV